MAAAGAMAAVGMGGSAAQGILGYISAKEEGRAQSSMSRYQAAVAQMNAQIAKQNADYARAVGEVEAQQGGMKTRAQLGSARAAQGGSGLDVNRGTHVKVRESIADVGAHNVEIIRNNAARRAYGHEIEAANAEASGKMHEAAAINQLRAAKLKGYASLIGGATGVASKFQASSASGAFGAPAPSNPRNVGSAISWES